MADIEVIFADKKVSADVLDTCLRFRRSSSSLLAVDMSLAHTRDWSHTLGRE